jgi:hypothetical protein
MSLGIEGIVSKRLNGALQVRPEQELGQGAQSEIAGVPADHRRVLSERCAPWLLAAATV